MLEALVEVIVQRDRVSKRVHLVRDLSHDRRSVKLTSEAAKPPVISASTILKVSYNSRRARCV